MALGHQLRLSEDLTQGWAGDVCSPRGSLRLRPPFGPVAAQCTQAYPGPVGTGCWLRPRWGQGCAHLLVTQQNNRVLSSGSCPQTKPRCSAAVPRPPASLRCVFSARRVARTGWDVISGLACSPSTVAAWRPPCHPVPTRWTGPLLASPPTSLSQCWGIACEAEPGGGAEARGPLLPSRVAPRTLPSPREASRPCWLFTPSQLRGRGPKP